MRSNTLSWNPMEAYYFTCANEDYKWVWERNSDLIIWSHFSWSSFFFFFFLSAHRNCFLFFFPFHQPLHIWHEVPGQAHHGTHGPCVCCARCWLCSHGEGVCVCQLWQDHPNLCQGRWTQQVSNADQTLWCQQSVKKNCTVVDYAV